MRRPLEPTPHDLVPQYYIADLRGYIRGGGGVRVGGGGRGGGGGGGGGEGGLGLGTS